MTQQEDSATGKTKFTYGDFINELRKLLAASQEFGQHNSKASSAVFKHWKLHLIDLLDSIEDAGYTVRCDVRNRLFDVMYGGSSSEAFARDLIDTVNELDLVVQKYDKYGVPTGALRMGRQPKIATPPPPLQPPTSMPAELPNSDKITWEWAKKHIPVSWIWKAGVGFVVAMAFMAGVAFEVGKWYESMNELRPTHAGASSVQAPEPERLPTTVPMKSASK